MKRTVSLFLILTMMVFTIGAVSAGTTYIAGKIYNADYSAVVPGATVDVTCGEITLHTVSNYTNPEMTLGDGDYSVSYDESVCHEGSSLSVHAYKAGVGENTISTEKIHDNYPAVDVNLGVVNVPLVPEFGAIVATLTILSALGVFFIVRRK